MILPEKIPDIYQYPEHLRTELNGLPTAPGVYVFHGDSETLPLYIGKVSTSVLGCCRICVHVKKQSC